MGCPTAEEEGGEEEIVKEEDPTMDPNLNLEAGGCEENDATQNRIKARKFNTMLKADQLPSWLAAAWEKPWKWALGNRTDSVCWSTPRSTTRTAASS